MMEDKGKTTKVNMIRKKKSKSKGCVRKSSSKFDNQISNAFTEFDEIEMLCLPNSNQNFSLGISQRLPVKKPTTSSNYPDNYNMQFITAEDRRKYRNSKDLRNNVQHKPEDLLQGICFRNLRGEKCIDMMCPFGHELRIQKKLRLCRGYISGVCQKGQLCVNLHSQFPCRNHYLGLDSVRHDPKTCIFYHGGPLSKDYEDMFLESLDPNRFPMAREMYENQVSKLKGNRCDSVHVEHNSDTFRSKKFREEQVENDIKQSPVTSVKRSEKFWKTEAVCESSDETKLQIDKDCLHSDRSSLQIAGSSCQFEESRLEIDESYNQNEETSLQIEENSQKINETSLQIDERCPIINESGIHINKSMLQINEASI